jgi:hypothetical protein
LTELPVAMEQGTEISRALKKKNPLCSGELLLQDEEQKFTKGIHINGLSSSFHFL